ncbi:MAG: family 10 glycosylhydrolase [Rhodoferax sp.]|nr:family 10 glycosylhydrolase [Rhodoferax sp.]
MQRRQLLAACAAAGGVACLGGCTALPTAGGLVLREAPDLTDQAPAAPREFRAAWVATVSNIDWPSRKGLSTAEQQTEMRAILDQAVALRLNAIILQIRTSADALYASALEPWSEVLTGTQDAAPAPFYDPLALWIEEAHARALELHAWLNPFRARPGKAGAPLSARHLSQSRPEWVRSYGDQLWIDPGEPAAVEHTVAVFMDVLRRYDVDAIHIDDYFYPYPVMQSEASRVELDFPDQPAWQRYLEASGTLSRSDWRRSNVDKLVERLHRSIRQTKPWVRFGISPFGLGRPDRRPPGIRGFSQYDKLYANVERWLEEGWLDYLVPQLYWAIAPPEQAFGTLLHYWHAQNRHGRHIWPGLFTSRLATLPDTVKPGWSARELLDQIGLVRQRAPGSGHAHFSMVALTGNRQRISEQLQSGHYAHAALVPATPWLPAEPHPAFVAHLSPMRLGDYRLQLVVKGDPAPTVRWVVWLRYGARWELRLCAQVPLELLTRTAEGDLLNAVVVSLMDRVGNEGPRQGFRIVEPIAPSAS